MTYEKEKRGGISTNKCAFQGKKCKYAHVEGKLYQYVMNTWKNISVVSMNMLQFEGCRLATKHNITICKFKVSYGWVRHFTTRYSLTNKALNDDNTEPTRRA
jgi:hypothetical protein